MNEYVKNLNRIEFVVTMACTGKCKHCSEGDHINCTDHIDADVAVTAIREICENYKIKSLMTFGGEPLIYPKEVCTIHRVASELGIAERQIITNGFFSKKFEKIEEIVSDLQKSGVNKILLSVDAFHQETIPLEPVMHFAKSISKAKIDIQLSPAWLVNKEDNNPYNVKTKEILKQFENLKIPVGSGNIIFPSGNALKYLHDYFEGNDDFSTPYDENPKDIRAICFSPNGDVLNGNIYQKGVLEILNEYKPKE